MILAYAALSAIGTTFGFPPPSASDPISFNEFITQIGVTTSGVVAEFMCPSTAVYFVHYRLFVVQSAIGSPCLLSLEVGAFNTTVSLVSTRQILGCVVFCGGRHTVRCQLKGV